MKLYFKIKFCLIVFIVGFLFYLPILAHAATLDLSLEKNITSPKDDVVVLVSINSEGQDVNTAQATIFFPANLLEVTNIDRTNSVFSFWLQEPVFDNVKGSINFVGGSTSGFTGASLKLMHIAFRVKGSGVGRLGITDGAITASDGTGSNVYTTAKGLDINIPSTADFQAVNVERIKKAATIAKELPAQMGLSVPFYPDPTKWNNHSASFKASWNISSDTISAAVVINKNPIFTPLASAEALLGNKIFSALSDGVWYLHIRLENNIGWSPTLHYRLAIDATPPNPFKIISNEGFKTAEPKPTINFASSDLTSGIDNYIVRLDGVIVASTNLTKYQFFPLLPGKHQLNVSAVDKAGNSTSDTETLEILPIVSPVITYVSRSMVANEEGIHAGGTASLGVEIIAQVQNSQKQIVAEQTTSVDSNGNWDILINKFQNPGEYNLLATARDKNMASSFPATSESITVKQRPVFVLGSLEISETWFFIYLIVILLGAFGAGYFTYYKWRRKLEKRVTIAERDVLNIFDGLRNDLDKLLKDTADCKFSESEIAETEYTLKKMKENLEKSRRYVVDNISEINK
ncbi:MAG: hypothetical protein WC793_02645 [Candidatus Paceibacterota bacterium]|jgi:hypothetical protein